MNNLAQREVTALILVTQEEAGQKLLHFLRRKGLAGSQIYKWMRTGQIRINGKRCQAQSLVNANDQIRLPPFYQNYLSNSLTSQATSQISDNHHEDSQDSAKNSAELEIIYSDANLMVINKPSGLATQGGRGHLDSLSQRLLIYAQRHGKNFVPAVAHRLDRDTSGLILVGCNVASLQNLSQLFREQQISKEYLAWVKGKIASESEILLQHKLIKAKIENKEIMQALDANVSQGREAKLILRKIAEFKNYSLVCVRLLTGGKHQIRVQLATNNLPIVGDCKYGNRNNNWYESKEAKQNLLLHAFRLILPSGQQFMTLPKWQGQWSVEKYKEQLAL